MHTGAVPGRGRAGQERAKVEHGQGSSGFWFVFLVSHVVVVLVVA